MTFFDFFLWLIKIVFVSVVIAYVIEKIEDKIMGDIKDDAE